MAFVSRYVVQAILPDVFLTRAFQEELTAELEEPLEECELRFRINREDFREYGMKVLEELAHGF